ncbi:hypothetical protein [Thermodesulfatator indicus]|nr:hypothetical protein [Thermodesulfatator indicus]
MATRPDRISLDPGRFTLFISTKKMANQTNSKPGTSGRIGALG